MSTRRLGGGAACGLLLLLLPLGGLAAQAAEAPAILLETPEEYRRFTDYYERCLSLMRNKLWEMKTITNYASQDATASPYASGLELVKGLRERWVELRKAAESENFDGQVYLRHVPGRSVDLMTAGRFTINNLFPNADEVVGLSASDYLGRRLDELERNGLKNPQLLSEIRLMIEYFLDKIDYCQQTSLLFQRKNHWQ